MKNFIILATTLALSLSAQFLSAKEYTVGQKNKEFTEKSLTLNVGDTVKFENQDPFFHNVFSLSELKTFDLGSFKKGKSKTVTFDKAGKVDVECAIHPNMRLSIEIK